jgi:hypothetical protein
MRLLIILLFVPVISWSQDCDSVPELNAKIVKLAKQKLKKKVGSGECWDLAKYVLDETGAVWNHDYEYGTLINYKTECIQPGDIIQFKNIKIQWDEGNLTYTEEMEHHTAIVYKVVSKDEIVLIHQNTGQHGRKVGTTKFLISAIKKGKIMVYRPTLN